MRAPPDYRQLFETSPGRYVVLAPDLTIVAVTHAYRQATKTSQDIVGRRLFDVFPGNPNDPSATGPANVKAHFQRILETRAADTMPVQKYDIPVPDEEGGGFEERYWALAGIPLLDDSGEVEYIFHFVDDVTGLLKMTRQRDESEQALGALQLHAATIDASLRTAVLERERAQAAAELERRNLHDFIMQAPAMLCILRGVNHVFETVNPAYLQLVGNRDIVGKGVREALPEIEGQGFYELLDSVYSTGEPFIGTEIEVRVDRGRAGLERAVVNFVYQPTRGADRAINGIAVYANEVTDLVDARRREADARTAAEEARRVTQALLEEVKNEARAMESAIHEMREQKDAAERRVRELETARGA